MVRWRLRYDHLRTPANGRRATGRQVSTGIFKLAHRNRIVAKRAIAALDRVLPRPLGRRLRRLTEILAFRFTPHYQGDTLPPIFHYWSERHVRPMLQARGYESPEDFYLKYVLAEAGRLPEPLHIVSLGTGACALEIGLAVTLRERGVDFRLTCVDINRGLLDAGRHAATAAGVGAAMRFKATDAGQALAALDVDADVIIANQIFHHLEDLEDTVAGIARCLASRGGEGVLLTSDIVGRNGHLLWPSVDRVVQERWSELPKDRRFDRFTNSAPTHYRAENHAAYSNEGVRAQDITRVLLDHLDFELFLTYAGSIIPFVERRIGFNFDPASDADRGFIDRVADEDCAAIMGGDYPASNMLAALRGRGRVVARDFHPVTPQAHASMIAREIAASAH
ncbi:class I SAM-dependent methyltransferase [Luteimonas changyuni]|uniref:class I SAM-dependent methyltransferase n=1 Tax=Luteimonas sp. MJ145 TaxID=3129234 RepID=UPI0031B9D532